MTQLATIRCWPFLALGAALASLVWAYWTTLAAVAVVWAHDPQYSHGYLVPAFALGLLWFRRDRCPSLPLQPTAWGALVLGGAIALRLFGTYYFFTWVSTISMLPMLAGLCLMIGGWAAWRWSWPAIVFLGFMIPLPHTISQVLGGRLQELATIVCTFLLQTLGVPAIAEGNVILLSEVEIGIVEACSGLRMLVIFFALSTAVALLLRRPFGERIVVVLSAVPIALIVNVIRITATGILHETVSSDVANVVFHDLAGWLMMPLALGILWLELQFLKHMWLAPPPAPVRRPAAPRSVRHRPRLAVRPSGAA